MTEHHTVWPRLLHDYCSLSARRFPDKAAVIHRSSQITYRELDIFSNRLAQRIQQTGVSRQDRIVIFMDGGIQAVVALFAVLKAGCVFIMVNNTIRPYGLSHILTDSKAALIIAGVNKAQVLASCLNDKHPFQILWYDSTLPHGWSTALPSGTYDPSLDTQAGDMPPVRMIDQDIAALIYTSGSTGQSKGVVCPHGAMVSAAQSIVGYLHNVPEDIILNVLPLSFDYGLYQVLMSVMIGATVVLENSFLFIHDTLKRIVECRVTGFPIVPTVAAMILARKEPGRYDLSSLRYMTNTGAALPTEHIKRIQRLWPHIRIFSMYGLTECKRVAYLPPEQLSIRPRSVGKAMPNCEVNIVDEQGNPCGPGQVGELVVRGANLMRGYWNAPELTAQKYRPGNDPAERLLYSGDMFTMDDEGYLYFMGRMDELLKCRGERISPLEIEEALHRMQGIAEAAVIGIDHPIDGQVPVAFVAIDGPEVIDEAAIKRYCLSVLERRKLPAAIHLRRSLPRTVNGKVDKKMLKQEIQS